ncbi:MAG TPA: hypothetical protein VKX40_07255 [Aequorivita sp.]|nr:hypothetical protein [Aequorivita sp.]
MKNNKIFKKSIAIALIAFALITVFVSSSVLFDWFGIRAKQGNYVPFIVKTNLTVGLIYLIAAYGFIKSNRWAFWAMLSAALLLVYAFILFYVHMHTGGLYEERTFGIMIFRIVFTLVFAVLIYISSKNET